MDPPSSLPNPKPTSPPTKRQKPPSPQELITHYESQGLDTNQASLKVIEDLQNLLFRVVTSNSRRSGKGKLPAAADTIRKIDSSVNRLAILEMKLDSKPGYGGAFTVGVASGVTVLGVGSVVPHVVKALGEAWSAVVGGIGANRHTP